MNALDRLARAALGALALAAAATAVPAATLDLDSGASRPVLVELYTSEGCSSCPPADRWMSGLRQHPGLWSELVPVAFHVDYWDYLGWTDRFADPAHAQRQRAHVRGGRVRMTYTPAFVIDGREWRAWFGSRRLPPPDRAAAGRLRARYDGTRLALEYARAPGEPDGVLTAHAALLGFGLSSQVRAGENAGRHLEHDFVVLSWARGRMTGGPQTARATLDLAEPRAGAVAVWVSRGNDPKPLQAAGGWLPEP